MVRRHGRRAVDPDAPVVDLDRVLADDREIDRIGLAPWPAGPASSRSLRTGHRAGGRHFRQTPDDSLFELLDDWRQELARPPLPDASFDLPRAPARPTPTRHRRRSWRPMVAVAAAIGAVLVGSATVGAAHADPNSPLWPITRMIWPARAQSIEATRDLQVALDEAREALRAGRGQDARLAIARAESELGNIGDNDARNEMRTKVVQLRAQTTASLPTTPTFEAASSSWLPTAPVTAASDTAPQLLAGQPSAADGPTSVGPPKPVAAPVGALAASSGSAAGTVTTTSPVASTSARETTAATATPQASNPAAPATVPDPSVVVEPPSASNPPTTESAVSSATQQSAPSPTQTTESATTSAPSQAARSVLGTDSGGAQSPASADDVEAETTTSAAPG